MSTPGSPRADDPLAELERLGEVDHLERRVAEAILRRTGTSDPVIAILAALAVRAPRRGHVHVDLADLADPLAAGLVTDPVAASVLPGPDVARRACSASPAVHCVDAHPDVDGEAHAAGDARPLVLRGTWVMVDRMDRAEGRLADDLVAALGRPVIAAGASLVDAVGRLFPPDADADQRRAVEVAATRGFSIITGGPGTGKTSVVVRLLATLALARRDGGEPPLRVALAAPTGKAAARLAESVREGLAVLDLPDEVHRVVASAPAMTLHRLLGWQPSAPSRFAHGRDRPLDLDVVVIDEASMIPLTLFADVLAAVGPATRLVLVGDRRQLASVEAGAVLDDLCGPGAPEAVAAVTVELRRSFRFPPTGGIGAAATALIDDAADAASLTAAVAGADPTLGRVEVLDHGAGELGLPGDVGTRVVATFRTLARDARDGADPATLLAAVDRVRLLAPLRQGPLGVETLNARVRGAVAREVPGFDEDDLPVGLPVLVTRNDHRLELYNGDVGIVVAPEGSSGRRVAFPSIDGGVRLVSPSRLPGYEPVFASSVHKSQGSQFAEVVLVLPIEDHPLLTRDLVYTGLTRARERLTVVASSAVLDAAVRRRVRRATGLRGRLAGS